MSMLNVKTKNKKILCLILVFSIVLNIIANMTLFSLKAEDRAELTEIPNFKGGWSYKLGVTEHTVEDAIQNNSGWEHEAKLPTGFANSGTEIRTYIANNGGTLITQPGTTEPSPRRNLVLQKTINITGLNNYTGFAMDLLVDDGAIVYINGVETLRLNAVKMNNASPTSATGIRLFDYERRYTIEDPLDFSQRMKTTYEKYFISKDLFKEGENKIVVAVLQDSSTSSDILFDGMLYSIPVDFEDITPNGTSVKYGDDWLWIKNYTSTYQNSNDWWRSENFAAAGVSEQTGSYRSNGWRVGATPIGYATSNSFFNDNGIADVSTSIPYSTTSDGGALTGGVQDTSVHSVNLRRAIDIEDVSKINNAVNGNLTMRVNHNRHMDIYINGELIFTYTASNSSLQKQSINVPVEKLVNGRNVISVSLRTIMWDNTSIYFDMDLPIEYETGSTPGENAFTEIPNFKDGWSYKTAVTENTVAEINSSTWATGKLPIGYAGGSSPLLTAHINNNGGTTITPTPQRNLVLQKTINITGLGNYSGFAMDGIAEDGAVIFVNGVEALRFNAKLTETSGTSGSGTRLFGYERRYVINDPLDQVNKSHYEKFVIDKSLFKEGNNFITVAVLNDAATSSDILFDGMLYTISKNFTDTITPSGTSIDYGDEWLWVKNDCENSWLEESFIPAGVKNPAAYTSQNHAANNPNGWKINSAPFGFDNFNNTGVSIATRIPHNTDSSESDPTDNGGSRPSNRNMSTNNVYLRRYLDINNISDLKNKDSDPIQNIIMKITRIRNVAVYVNGEEVYRTLDGIDSTVYKNTVKIPVSKFKQGRNIISVDLINSTPGAPSIYFDMKVIMDEDDSGEEIPAYKTDTIFDFGSAGWSYKADIGGIEVPNPFPVVDATWTAAKLPLGYANSGSNITNIITNGANNRIVSDKGISILYTATSGTTMPSGKGTAILQRTFEVTDLNDIEQFQINAIIDDGLVVFINGKVAALLNASAGNNSSNITAYGYRRMSTIDDPFSNPSNRGQSVWKGVSISKKYFEEGTNTITLLLLNDAVSSSDFFVDIKLTATDEPLGFQGKNFIMTPGKKETDLNFLWHSPYIMEDDSDVVGQSVQFERTSSLQNGEFTGNSNIVPASISIFNGNTQVNKVAISGLAPNTEYTYRYGDADEDNWSDMYTFKTGGEENKVIFVTDVQIGAGNGVANDTIAWNNTLNKAVEKIPDASFILSAGDNTEDGLETEYAGMKAAEKLKNLPYASASGNHDTRNDNFPNHYNHPNMTNLGVVTATGDYYFSYGNTLYMVLNSNSSNVAEHKQAMEMAIASHPNAKWRVVVMHFDVFGAGPHATGTDQNFYSRIVHLRNNLTPVFNELDIDIVLNGHDHVYARSFFMDGNQPQKTQIIDDNNAVINPDGVLYITGSTASSKFYNKPSHITPNWLDVYFDQHVFQFSELDITNDTFTITTYRTDNLSVVDTVTIRKEESNLKAKLRDTINDANNLVNSAVVGVKPGQYPQAAKDTLNMAILEAEAIFLKTDVSEQELNNAVTELEFAMETFREQVVPSPIVTDVIVSPTTVDIKKGSTHTFTAVVSGSNNPSQSVTWKVEGGTSETTISADGVLTVSENETATELIVRATSTVDGTKSGTASITVRSGDTTTPPDPTIPTIPDTGDNSNVIIWLWMGSAAVFGLSAAVIVRRRKEGVN